MDNSDPECQQRKLGFFGLSYLIFQRTPNIRKANGNTTDPNINNNIGTITLQVIVVSVLTFVDSYLTDSDMSDKVRVSKVRK